MSFSGSPKANKDDCSPALETMPYTTYLDNPYFADVYSQTPDYALNTFFDSESFFERPLTSVETASGMPSKPQAMFNPTLPATGISASSSTQPSLTQAFNPMPFGQLEQYPFGTLDPTPIQPIESNGFSPTAGSTSQTPSLCGETSFQTVSPSLSPHVLKRESPSSPYSGSESLTPKRPTRKRGRPRLDRSSIDTQLGTSPSRITSTSQKCPRPKRLPHNQVERKYREGLNSELERLRRAIPLLRQTEEAGAMGQQKPSKAMVLSSAIEYIRQIEQERDALREENEKLRLNQMVQRL
ncbi:hypothetical protein BDW02DRAFT_45236 [Decorospora gaudefroyi]|uniref:BHLH domain-containing protein n=1 Tax=Decorospora gaudefroyi TaxID=184978 RepID=A0A6A5K5D6_9PLEO|nr:hypothetical protein BDW02DRAFT_45236 [Decorospora gaudefroyi]